MSTGATIATIKAGLIAKYQAITLPGGLGVPVAIGWEIDQEPPSLPYIEVHVNPTQRIAKPRDEGSYQVTRLFIVRLYIAPNNDKTPSVENPDFIKAENCIEPIEDYFLLTNDRLDVYGVTEHVMTADTAGTPFPTRANRDYVGVAFEHLITYYRHR